ncbi:hypothetical protein M0R72_12140 [Candidatus Pacearchaeota archaeon]|jgi:hypothetical protein|nr:hypothetical protein [Candidatus Pacearchaeota archaeon]
MSWNDALAKQLAKQAGMAALHDAAEIILAESGEKVPHASGELESKGDILDQPSEMAVVIFYTGPYACRQHEDALQHPDPTNPHSREGREDHYLENAFNGNQKKAVDMAKAKLDAALR